MNFQQLVAGDPLSTALDRAIATDHCTLGSWYSRVARAAWALHTPEERAELVEYWQAVQENACWDAERERDLQRKLHWSAARGRYVGETDGEWRCRVAALKWRGGRGRWVFVGARVQSPQQELVDA